MTSQSLFPVSLRDIIVARNPNSLNSLLVLLIGLGEAIVIGYLLVTGQMLLAIAVLLLIPILIGLHHHPFLALIVWLLLTPFLLHTTTSAERNIYWLIHRALPPLTVIIILIGATLKLRPRKLPRLGVAEIAMAGYIVVGILSILLYNSTPTLTLYRFYDRAFSPMCLYLIVRLTMPGKREWSWMLGAVVFMVVSQLTVGMVSWVAPALLPAKWLDKVGLRTTGTLVNPSIFTTALIFAGILLFHHATQLKSRAMRSNYVMLFMITLFGVFISLSRASWLAGIVVVIAVISLYPKLLLKYVLTLTTISLLLGAVVISPYADRARQRILSEEAEGSALDRLPGYLAAVRMFEAKPLLGWGYGNFDEFDRQFAGRVLDFANDNKDHASHNWYLTILAEQGLIGFLLFMGPALWWLAQSHKKWNLLNRESIWSRRLLLLLWLVVLAEIVINNFINLLIFFGHGIWWIVLALIANILVGRFSARSSTSEQVWQLARPHFYEMGDVQ